MSKSLNGKKVNYNTVSLDIDNGANENVGHLSSQLFRL